MKTAFYINYDDKREWYMLCLRETHFCMSCGKDLDFILKKVGEFVKRYKTKERMMRSLSELESKGLVTPKVFQQREDYYKSHGNDFSELLLTTVETALIEVRIEEKVNSPFNKTKKRIKKKVTPLLPIEESAKPRDYTPATISRRKPVLKKVLLKG